MNRMILAFSIAASLSSVGQAQKPAAAQPAAKALSGASADERAIRAQIDHWLALVKARDAAAIAALYAEDGALMAPNSPIGTGREAIRQGWASMMQMPGFDLSFTPDQIVVAKSGDLALDRGTYRFTVAPDGNAMTDTGKYVVVWRKVGKEWKAAADIFNSDLPASKQ